MAQALVGKPFTFQVLFVDSDNQPMIVLSPTISLYFFDSSGIKVSLVNNDVMSEVSPPEVGRYTYTYTIPSSFVMGDTIYAQMEAYDAVLADTKYLVEDSLSVLESYPSARSGLIARFIK